MFILHSSNKTENLVEHLVSVIANVPLSTPFAQEVFLIQSQGMERWLSQQLAERCQVWANFDFLFPWKFFSYIAQQVDSRINDAAFDRSQLLWRIEAILRKPDNSTMLLNGYLSGNNPAIKRFQLAKQLAQLFDQYQSMRPDMLDAWQAGTLLYDTETERWQSELWRKLTLQIGQSHRGKLWREVIDKLNQAAEGSFSNKLPERVSVFGINTMPPLFLAYLQSLAKQCDIHLYLFNPAQGYWADLSNKRQTIDLPPDNHPLLRSLGQQGREFQEMLLDICQFDFEQDSFQPIANPNNLQQLQNDILDNHLTGHALTIDRSISLHACHSRKREVEVLKDQLLMALEADPNLALREIRVMAPDIQKYEPFISAIFHDIPHSVADRSLRHNNQALDVFIRFVELSQSRLGWQSVLDVLTRDLVYPAFGLSETDIALINYWVQDTHVRWGQSGEHKQELGLPPLNENTWQAALDRLLMGYAVGHDDNFVLGVLPYIAIEGSAATALGGLHDFLQLVFAAKTEFKQAKPLKAWGTKLAYYAEQLLSSVEFAERQPINELLTDLTTSVGEFHQAPIELAVILQWLNGTMTGRLSVNGFLRGQLTFCSMIPMRAIPGKVVALMGINEGEFPKIDRNPTFDLIAQHFRPGDRSRRADDRYQFLETLLSARQQLIITYLGQSQSNNAVIPPSVVVSELVDVLREYYQLDKLTTFHPLQAFSPRYFDKTSDLFSFSQNHCATAQALTNTKPEPKLWWQGELAQPPEDIIELDDLLRFYQHPQRYFLRQQLNLQLTGIQYDVEERERFALDSLDAYKVHEDWVQQLLAGDDITLPKIQAEGKWLAGSIGELTFTQHKSAVNDFVGRIKATHCGEPLPNKAVDMTIGNYRLVGNLSHCYQQASLHYRLAALKGRDFIGAWLHHLVINKMQPQSTYLLTDSETFIFPTALYQPDYLPMLIAIYQQGKQQPAAFFTEAAIAYTKQAVTLKNNTRAKADPFDSAIKCLQDQISKDADVAKLFGNVADLRLLLGDSFSEQCATLLLPAWEAAHVI
jgi:exodeoxyribonuclease V gamma subunit